MPVVVAHLHRFVVSAPLAPVEGRGWYVRPIARPEAKQRLVVHARGADDLSRVHQAARVEPGLDLAQARCEARAEERRDPLRAHQAIAMLARVRALELLDRKSTRLNSSHL